METLQTLLEHAEGQRNTALAAFNQARARRDAARDQAAQLAAYRTDYQRRWQAQFQQGGAALAVLRCYQQFNERLDVAIAQQAHGVEVCEGALARANDLLAAHELRVASVRKLIERRLAEQRRDGERREQKDNDEWAQRIVQRQRASKVNA
ncbi:MAG TPA: flagellar export protein FliJ [Burkholderiaceae bacterium]|nr:flagellar export protein FliJ [Burkholderiaceae bacterium]